MDSTDARLANIQGDIIEGLPKKREAFLFFRIRDIAFFRTQLAALLPLITSVTDARAMRDKIDRAKQTAAEQGTDVPIVHLNAVNIAFSRKGLEQLGINDDLHDAAFNKGMVDDAEDLFDDKADWDPAFLTDIHGVILCTASCQDMLDAALAKVSGIFKPDHKRSGIVEVKRLFGKVRPDDQDGHEHFGFKDGLTQPAIKDMDLTIQNGQDTIRQGIVLLGRDGDGLQARRPKWATDSSFLVFRYLRQNVPEFKKFLRDNAVPVKPGPNAPTGAQLLGARMVGRWESGAPIDISPNKDDPELAKPEKNQFFRFTPSDQRKCPFAAHIRKTNPRGDLDEFGGTETRRILRRGIPFGEEVTQQEEDSGRSSDDASLERGLLFACYQSSIENGFQFIQKSWVNDANFPFPPFVTDAISGKNVVPGSDALVGRRNRDKVVGMVSQNLEKPTRMEDWVIPRGGEYFISPTKSALVEVFAQSTASSAS